MEDYVAEYVHALASYGRAGIAEPARDLAEKLGRLSENRPEDINEVGKSLKGVV